LSAFQCNKSPTWIFWSHSSQHKQLLQNRTGFMAKNNFMKLKFVPVTKSTNLSKRLQGGCCNCYDPIDHFLGSNLLFSSTNRQQDTRTHYSNSSWTKLFKKQFTLALIGSRHSISDGPFKSWLTHFLGCDHQKWERPWPSLAEHPDRHTLP